MAGLNYVTFNQDHGQLAVATTRGLRVYSTDPFELITHSYDDDISLVEQLFSTSLVALILTPRLLRIVNTKKHSTICELTFHGMVVAVRMNRKRLVVVLEEVAFIYDLSNMKMLKQHPTPLNPAGLCAIAPSSEHSYLALPHLQRTPHNAKPSPSHVPPSVAREPISGDVLIYDLNTMEEVAVITAHQTPVSCLAINTDGTLLATASEKGTVVRVFSLPEGKKVYQFRRGSMPARIFCMSFNATSTLLCVSSATETVHIFKLAPPNTTPSPSPAQQANGHHHTTTTTSPPLSPSTRTRDRSLSPSSTHSSTPSLSPPHPNTSPSAPQPRQPGLLSLMRRTSASLSTTLATRAANYLPANFTEIWEPQRDFAWVRLPRQTNTSTTSSSSAGLAGGGAGTGAAGGGGGGVVRTVIAMDNHTPHLLIATGEGEFLIYAVDLERGGEGRLVRRYEYVPTTSSSQLSALGREARERLRFEGYERADSKRLYTADEDVDEDEDAGGGGFERERDKRLTAGVVISMV